MAAIAECDSFTPFLLKFPTEIRQRIYDFVFEGEAGYPELGDRFLMPEHQATNSFSLSMNDRSQAKQFLHYFHINRASRSDMINQYLSRATLTVELEALVAILQLLTPGMRTNVQHIFLVGNFGNESRYHRLEWAFNMLREYRTRTAPNLAHHRVEKSDARYMGLKDLMHTYRGLPNLKTLTIYPLPIQDTLDWMQYGDLDALLRSRVFQCILEFRGLRHFSIDCRGNDRVYSHCGRSSSMCDCMHEFNAQNTEKRKVLQAAEKLIQATVVDDSHWTF
ncbi:hypothetical protein NA57DRAFT_78937 [Rhizodiscina lignyota]|uniref:Uncharacterized protein n=1 Tax=Rhizodiscina lignyota TaxID=1504668 RepID=A0A9P4IDD1_9PEZI|nr:hypothetical protein NA57DRAFT_78937 [Rhizodiscina lignyota]